MRSAESSSTRASTVIDLGRKRRFTGNARHALLLRDRHCAWAGCTVPARHTQGDHTLEHSTRWADESGQRRPDVPPPQPVQEPRLPHHPRPPRPLAHLPTRRHRNRQTPRRLTPTHGGRPDQPVGQPTGVTPLTRHGTRAQHGMTAPHPDVGPETRVSRTHGSADTAPMAGDPGDDPVIASVAAYSTDPHAYERHYATHLLDRPQRFASLLPVSARDPRPRMRPGPRSGDLPSRRSSPDRDRPQPPLRRDGPAPRRGHHRRHARTWHRRSRRRRSTGSGPRRRSSTSPAGEIEQLLPELRSLLVPGGLLTPVWRRRARPDGRTSPTAAAGTRCGPTASSRRSPPQPGSTSSRSSTAATSNSSPGGRRDPSPCRRRGGQPFFRSVTSPWLASTNLCGSMPKTSCQVPAAAHTSSYWSRSGSMKICSGVAWPNGGTPPMG